jgi:ribosomal protein S27E
MSKLDNPISYFFYAKGRWGTAEAVKRVWEFHLHPRNLVTGARERYREWRLVDRRKKKSYSSTVYAVDRDGDLYLVECPKCHNTQSVVITRRSDESCTRCGKEGITHFHCFRCSDDFGWDVYLEDGLRELKDHREGNPPNPCIVVRDDSNVYRLGIDREAPWWWRRSQVWYDFNPDNGKDAHGHQPYFIWDIDPVFLEKRKRMNCCEGDCAAPTTYVRQPGDPIDPAAEKEQPRADTGVV